jgi:hypothetical protein
MSASDLRPLEAAAAADSLAAVCCAARFVIQPETWPVFRAWIRAHVPAGEWAGIADETPADYTFAIAFAEHMLDELERLVTA